MKPFKFVSNDDMSIGLKQNLNTLFTQWIILKSFVSLFYELHVL